MVQIVREKGMDARTMIVHGSCCRNIAAGHTECQRSMILVSRCTRSASLRMPLPRGKKEAVRACASSKGGCPAMLSKRYIDSRDGLVPETARRSKMIVDLSRTVSILSNHSY
jgi:hypothetical protein